MKKKTTEKSSDATATPGRQDPASANPWLGNTSFWLMIAIALFYLVMEHRAHVIAGLPWLPLLPLLLLLVYPLMHAFGRRGRGARTSHAANHREDKSGADDTESIVAASDVDARRKAQRRHLHGGDLP